MSRPGGLRAACVAASVLMQVFVSPSILRADSAPTAEFQVAALPPNLAEREGPASQGSNGDLAPVRAGPFWLKWRALEDDIAAETSVLIRCRAEPENCDSPAARTFIAIINTARPREGRARIGELNRTINLAIRPVSDMVQHGVPDLWSSPLATFTSRQGDCEDYAIAKLVALRELGFSDDDLRLLVVHERGARALHAVAAVRFEGRWLVLDNRRLAMIDLADARFTWQMALQYEPGVAPVAVVTNQGTSAAQDLKITDVPITSSGAATPTR